MCSIHRGTIVTHPSSKKGAGCPGRKAVMRIRSAADILRPAAINIARADGSGRIVAGRGIGGGSLEATMLALDPTMFFPKPSGFG